MVSERPDVFVPASKLTPGGTLTGTDLQALTTLLVHSRGIALIPSDTCYSVAARPADISLSRTINRILDRDDDPISLAFAGQVMVAKWAILTPVARRLLEAFTPGPITIVCRAADGVRPALIDNVLTAPDGTVGVRIPDSQVERQLSDGIDGPVTTIAVRYPRSKEPVRNLSDAIDIVTAGMERLESRPPLLGVVEGRQEFRDRHSTVVKVPGPAGRAFSIERQGAITPEAIRRVASHLARYEVQDWT